MIEKIKQAFFYLISMPLALLVVFVTVFFSHEDYRAMSRGKTREMKH